MWAAIPQFSTAYSISAVSALAAAWRGQVVSTEANATSLSTGPEVSITPRKLKQAASVTLTVSASNLFNALLANSKLW
jgi:hypothetical protein